MLARTDAFWNQRQWLEGDPFDFVASLPPRLAPCTMVNNYDPDGFKDVASAFLNSCESDAALATVIAFVGSGFFSPNLVRRHAPRSITPLGKVSLLRRFAAIALLESCDRCRVLTRCSNTTHLSRR